MKQRRRRPMNFAAAIIKVGNGVMREKRWLRKQIKRGLAKLTHAELCGVKDLVTTLVAQRRAVGPRNRRFMTRKEP